MLFVSPRRVYDEAQTRAERLGAELRQLREPGMEILFEARNPYVHHSSSSIVERYQLYRVGVRSTGARTVDDLRVEVTDVVPRPAAIFPPLLLQAMHDRPGQKRTEFHPGDHPWYFDVVDQDANGVTRILHVVGGVGYEVPPGTYSIEITASGRDVPSASKWFDISVPSAIRMNQGLRFTPSGTSPLRVPSSSAEAQ